MQRSPAGMSREDLNRQGGEVDSRLLLEGANFSRDQAGGRLFRKPALRRRLLRLASLIVIAIVSVWVWVAAIWMASGA